MLSEYLIHHRKDQITAADKHRTEHIVIGGIGKHFIFLQKFTTFLSCSRRKEKCSYDKTFYPIFRSFLAIFSYSQSTYSVVTDSK